jgi:hypothetical protein
MRNDRNSLVEWLQNSDSVKFGNLMWNGEGVDENHGVRSFEPIPINETDTPQQKEDKEKLNKKNNIRVNQLVTYLLEQR